MKIDPCVPGDPSERFEHVMSQLHDACNRAGRSPDAVELIAVSKTHPPSAVAALAAVGGRIFGESRVQEARAKIPLCPDRLRWHFIGHLQSNKLRAALPWFECFHGIDSLDLALQADRIAADLALHPRVLLQVNVAGESSKFGFSPEAVERSLETLLALPRLQIEGLMTIPPASADPEGIRPFFRALRALRDRLASSSGAPLTQLSMGMSGDFPVAIEEGATMVRVGSALFGQRTGAGWRPEAGEA
jgi:pyridoxal phosphate enzyme (YggS family)